MIPIFQHGFYGSKGYKIDEFICHLVEICEEHREKRRAMLFAIILWDFTHPHISKVLDDKSYWRALDEISGNKVSIFSVHTPEWLIKQDESRTETSSKAHTEQILQQYFRIDHPVQLPAVLFFQVGDGEITGHIFVSLVKEKIEESFLELNKLVREVVESVSEVRDEFHSNSEAIFSLVLGRLEYRKVKAGISAIFALTKNVKDIGSILKWV